MRIISVLIAHGAFQSMNYICITHSLHNRIQVIFTTFFITNLVSIILFIIVIYNQSNDPVIK